ncbi:MAG: hypothetical protein ACJAVT_000315 [Yoonia sp.]
MSGRTRHLGKIVTHEFVELRNLVAKQIPVCQPDGAAVLLPMDGIFIVRPLMPSSFNSISIGPFASLILEGQREARLDDHVMVFSERQTSVLAHDVKETTVEVARKQPEGRWKYVIDSPEGAALLSD